MSLTSLVALALMATLLAAPANAQRNASNPSGTGFFNNQAAPSANGPAVFPVKSAPQVSLAVEGHRGTVTAMVGATRSNLFLSGSTDRMVKLWNGADLRLVRNLRPPTNFDAPQGSVTALALSPDAGLAAVATDSRLGSDTHHVYLFDARTGALKRRLSPLLEAPTDLAFSDDERYVAAIASNVDVLHVFATADGRALAGLIEGELVKHALGVRWVGTQVHCVSADGVLRVWSVQSGSVRLVSKVTLTRAVVTGFEISPDGRQLAFSTREPTEVVVVPLGQPTASRQTWRLPAGKDLSGMDFLVDSSQLRLLTQDASPPGTAGQQLSWLWDPRTGRTTPGPALGRGDITALARLPTGPVVMAWADGRLALADERTLRVTQPAAVHDFRGQVLKANADASAVQVGSVQVALFGGAAAVPRADTRRTHPKLKLSREAGDWQVNGELIVLNPSEEWNDSAAAADGTQLLIGTSAGLRLVDARGIEVWSSLQQLQALAVHLAADGRHALAAYEGGVVRWHRMQDGTVVLSMFHDPQSGGWVAWTDEGFFVSGEGGESLLGWHINQGADREATHLTSEKLFDVFYRADVLRAKLSGDQAYLARAMGGVSVETALRNPPPSVALQALAEPALAPRVRLQYEIQAAAGGVGEVRVFHNGKLVASDGSYRDAPGSSLAPLTASSENAARYVRSAAQRSGGAPAGATGTSDSAQLKVRGAAEKRCQPGQAGNPCAGALDVDVIPGEENTLTVVAFNRDNSIQSAPATVKFRSGLAKEEPQLWVLAVGIDRFAGVPALVNARKDAQDFLCQYAGRAAVNAAGLPCAEPGRAASLFAPGRIHVVAGLLDEQATKRNILNGLAAVAAQAKPGDTFIWFVSSHGLMDANSLFAFVAHDTRCLNTDCTELSNHVTSNEILEASKKIRAMRQLVVLDTCHSGGLDAKLSGLYDARISVLARHMGLHLYASAQATELASDGATGSNGLFTGQLLEGLRGAAPVDAQGRISMVTLGQWARTRTVAASQEENRKAGGRPTQTPVIQHFGQDAGLALGKR